LTVAVDGEEGFDKLVIIVKFGGRGRALQSFLSLSHTGLDLWYLGPECVLRTCGGERSPSRGLEGEGQNRRTATEEEGTGAAEEIWTGVLTCREGGLLWQ